MTRTLVTGGCGFVGRQLVRRLLQIGHEVWIIDDLSTGLAPEAWLSSSARQTNVKFIYENLAVTMLKQLGWFDSGEKVQFPAFDYVYALASIVGGRLKIDHDPLAVGVDLALDALFFQWLALNRQNIGRVLYASSSAAYPIHLQTSSDHAALREEMIDFASGKLGQPDMTYGWSKLTGEYLSRLAASHYGMSVGCVRPFSGYGEGQDVSYPVPAIALRVARGDDPVTVWGSGKQARDFVHIDDCITAMLLAIDRIHDGSAVNIGTGRLTTFLEVAGLFLKLAGRTAAIKPMLDKPVGVQSRYCDPSRVQTILDWKPTISLEEGFGRVLEEARQRVAPPSPVLAAAGAER